MAVIDLTHPLSDKMPVFPGEPGPVIRHAATIDDQGYRVLWLEMSSHTGTHMDAPAHLVRNGKTLDLFPVSQFCGKAVILPVPENTRVIGVPFLSTYAAAIGSSGYVILKTGWSMFWGSERYFSGFPVLSEEAARWLTAFPLKGIGLDTISADPVDSKTLPIHHILLEAGWVIVENLCFPENFQYSGGTFCGFPLHLPAGDGSPVRAVLFTGDDQ